MARRKTLPESVQTKFALAERLAALRKELFGERGGPELARRLGLPIRTWYNYEAGVTVPAEVILRLIEMTSVEPLWLLHGTGPQYRIGFAEDGHHRTGPAASANVLLRKALELLEKEKSPAPGPDPMPSAPVVHAGQRTNGLGAAGDARMMPVPDPDSLCWTEPGQSEPEGAQNPCVIKVSGDAMAPIAGDGAYVACSLIQESIAALDGKLVVAWLDGAPILRWFEMHGRYGILRAENAETEESQRLVDVSAFGESVILRRVLWINTHH